MIAAVRLGPARPWDGASRATCVMDLSLFRGPRGKRSEATFFVRCSNFEELGFLVFQRFVHVPDVRVRQLFEFFLSTAYVVLADLAVLLELFQRVLGMPADVADRDPRLFRLVVRDLDEVLAALFGQLWEDDAHDLAVVGRVDAEVAVADRLLDRAEG